MHNFIVILMVTPSFNLQPTLIGKLLKIRPLTRDDFDELYEVASDRLIWEQHPFPRYEREAFTDFFNTALQSNSGVVAIDQKTQSIVGASRFYNLQSEQVFIGYTFLARSHWGGEFNRELKSLMLGHVFKTLDCAYFDIGETNLRSRRAIEKIRASFIKFQTINEKPYTLYRISKEAFITSMKGIS